MTFARVKTALLVVLLSLGTASAASAYIGQGIQGRPHGGAKAALRYYNYRHGYGYTRHPHYGRRSYRHY